MSRRAKIARAMTLLAAFAAGLPAVAQDLDLGGKPGAAPQPIQITASQGIEWRQTAQEVIATGGAKAVRGAVTVQADQLIAHYRKKAGAAGAPAPAPAPAAAATDPTAAADALNTGSVELYQLDAVGNVHIYTTTDNAYGDHAVYSLDSAVLVLTGKHLKLTTPNDVVTARDSIEYYSVKREAVARGAALIVASDGRSISADTLIGYLAPASAAPAVASPASAGNADPLTAAGQLRKVDAIGHVIIHTTTDTATGNTGVYLPQSGQARLGGNVHIKQGPNQLTGSDALVNMKTGVATLLAAPGGQVAGVILPNAGPGK